MIEFHLDRGSGMATYLQLAQQVRQARAAGLDQDGMETLFALALAGSPTEETA
ncbi:hypothetical protein HS048_26940 [Planomonospora sp. ID91781]|uniref:hypothetical protein n=1 Tax=Planomonospora sp. ID91781 TaxID=2738135 RepID=UPI0018C357EA|nr:hypothetical protein [Planomonospora sp. ID91781]MBG0824348.1 hypothetical protein [Planomonospora sp. ID91781]